MPSTAGCSQAAANTVACLECCQSSRRCRSCLLCFARVYIPTGAADRNGLAQQLDLVAELQGGAGHLRGSQLHKSIAPFGMHRHVHHRVKARCELIRECSRHGAVEQLPQGLFSHQPCHQVAHIDLVGWGHAKHGVSIAHAAVILIPYAWRVCPQLLIVGVMLICYALVMSNWAAYLSRADLFLARFDMANQVQQCKLVGK